MTDFTVDMSHLSVADMFKIGVGPSSSHTVGPMLASWMFATFLQSSDHLASSAYVKIDLYGSLALTGKGHMTDMAVIVGLSGNRPDTVQCKSIPHIMASMRKTKTLHLAGCKNIPFVEKHHVQWHFDTFLPQHPNAMHLSAIDESGRVLVRKEYFSIGGGFVLDSSLEAQNTSRKHNINPPYPYHSARELLDLSKKHGLSIASIQRHNETAWRSNQETDAFLNTIASTMFACIENGINNTGILPGSLKVRRRANAMYKKLQENASKDPLVVMDWVSLYALAVNEENAACGQVVTAPTNGSAGVIPAILKYYMEFCKGTQQGVREILLVAGAIGTLYKKRASISAAAVGCQGEVGVSCSMAAAGLTSVLGGTSEQIENAAEIAMEHNLGLTCDPIGGLVQIPCIERNTMGAIKAINASRLALASDGKHVISLDSCIETMRQTGVDMQSKYKETAQGGLAVNYTEC